jgi:hypothetical protein
MNSNETKMKWRLLGFTWLGFLFYSPLHGQAIASGPSTAVVVPPGFEPKLRALGDRYTTTGKERITLRVSIQKGGAAAVPATMIYQLGGNFSYVDGLSSIVFNSLTSLFSLVNADNEALMETVFEDSIDGLLFKIPKLGHFRNLMNRARLDDGTTPNYAGPYLDVYQVLVPLPSLPGTPRRTKHFYFDSSTQLLDRVRFVDTTSGQVLVEELYQNWIVQNGVPVPSVISRTEGGVARFTVTVNSIIVGPAVSDGAFTLP